MYSSLEKFGDYVNKKRRGQVALLDYIDTILSRLNLLIARAHVMIAKTDAISSVIVLENQTRFIFTLPRLLIDIVGNSMGIRKTITIAPED